MLCHVTNQGGWGRARPELQSIPQTKLVRRMNVRHVCKCCVVIALVVLGCELRLEQGNIRGAGPGGCRGRGASAHARAGARGLCGNRDFRSRAGHRGAESAAGRHRGTAARPETGGGQRRVDSRLLGLGRRAERLPVGQRHLVRPAAGSPMGARLLGQVRQGFQWTSGYWADAKASEVEYLPEPPATVEAGPNIAAPSADTLGCPAVGCGIRAATPGVPVSGRPCSRIGFGSPPITSGPRAATSSSMATGITRSAVAACCLRRSISIAASYAAGVLLLAATVIDLGVFANHLSAAALPTLLLRRLLRRQLPDRRVLPVVFVQIRPLRLRSDLRSPALAASAGPGMGSPRGSGLPEPPRSRGRCDRRVRGRPRETQHARSESARKRSREWRATGPTGHEQRTIRGDFSRSTRRHDRGSVSTGKRSRTTPRGAAKLEIEDEGRAPRSPPGIRAGSK